MIISLSDLLDGIRRRKAELGIVDTEERTDAMRNSSARPAFVQDESIMPDALVQASGPSYLTAGLSL